MKRHHKTIELQDQGSAVVRVIAALRLNALTLLTLACSGPALAQSQPPPQNQVDFEGEPLPTAGDLKFPVELINAGLVSGLVLHGYSGDTFRQMFAYSPGSDEIRRVKEERGTPTETWFRSEQTEGVGFLITACAVRNGGDELYVAGIVSNGDCIIQKWTYTPRAHGWMVWYPTGNVSTLGVPMIPAAPTLSVTDGGDWVAPTPREQVLQPAQRETIYTSPMGMENGEPTPSGVLSGLVVDPQGRYILVFDRAQKQILRIDRTQSPNVVTPITTLGTHPSIDLADDMRLMDLATGGRRLVVLRELTHVIPVSPTPWVHTVGTDANNDGTFESWEVLDRASWDASSYSDWSNWRPYWRE